VVLLVLLLVVLLVLLLVLVLLLLLLVLLLLRCGVGLPLSVGEAICQAGPVTSARVPIAAKPTAAKHRQAPGGLRRRSIAGGKGLG
jgi:hypothetical protein